LSSAFGLRPVSDPKQSPHFNALFRIHISTQIQAFLVLYLIWPLKAAIAAQTATL
jgi:hypothetical protein